jgi:hypothetical protein
VDARLPDDLKRPLHAVDDDANLFACEADRWRLRYPWCRFDQRA